MQTKRKLQLHGSVDEVIEEAIRRELKRHDDIARLVWWAGSLTRAELVSSSSNTIRVWLGDKRMVTQVVSVDLSAASAVIEKGALTLHQKVVVTKGVTVLLYAQCMLLLKDSRAAAKRVIESEFHTEPRVGLPRSKSRSRHQVLATTDDLRRQVWNAGGKKLLKDKKVRLECLDSRMKTPNANDGFAYNKMIMGVGIYSQYEFDEDNNLRKQLTHIVKWNKPTNETSVDVEDVTDSHNHGTSRLCDVSKKPVHLSGYLYNLRDDNNLVNTREGVKLRKIKRSALSTYDTCIILTTDGWTASKRHRTVVKFSSPWEGNSRHDGRIRERDNTNPKNIFTLHDIDAMLRQKFDLKYQTFLVTRVERNAPKRQRVTRTESKGLRAKEYTNVSNAYKLRSSTQSAEGDIVNVNVHNKMKAFCIARDSENLIIHSLKGWLLDSTQSRFEASICFLSVLKLATQGMLSLRQDGADIAVEILS